jgi:membrane-associated phospholipid phosphatase
VAEILKPELAPGACRWCAVDSVDLATQRALAWPDLALADTLSSVGAFVLVPLAAGGLEILAAARENTSPGDVGTDMLLIAEAGVIAADVNQLTKLLVGRERPFAHARTPEEKKLTPAAPDDDLSFFSGHTSEAFALAAASGTVGELRGYRLAPLAWGVGGAFAAASGYLRIAADRHWLTDVLVGAVIGVGIGVGIPCIFHPRVGDAPGGGDTAMARAILPPPQVPTLSFRW